jgi:hypothetical protein
LTPLSPPLEKVCQLFPDRTFLVTQLARDSEAFVALCEEYDLAVDALHQLEGRGHHAAPDLLLMAEYRALIEELKLDLLRALQTSESASRH